MVDINIDSTAGIFEHVEIVRDAFNDIAAQGYPGVVTQGFCAFYSRYAAVRPLESSGLTLRCRWARKTALPTQDEGQERQEAKTEDCQEDKRPET